MMNCINHPPEGASKCDVSALFGLSNLVDLSITNSAVKDISAIANLPKPNNLHLFGNRISDITALSGLTNLTRLDLGENGITDVAPLVENKGIDRLDHLLLSDNPLDCRDQTTLDNLEVLRRRAVYLSHDCD